MCERGQMERTITNCTVKWWNGRIYVSPKNILNIQLSMVREIWVKCPWLNNPVRKHDVSTGDCWKLIFKTYCQVCAVFVRAFTLFPFRSFMLLPVCHCFLPVSSPCASLFPPCAFLCLFVYAMCSLVVVRVSTPHLFPIITLFVCLICFSCVLLIPLV